MTRPFQGPFWLGRHPEAPFPPVEYALEEPNGLLALGGDLSLPRLLNAYRRGIFPWYSAGQPILWWSPNPRLVLPPGEIRISRSLRKRLRQRPFEIRFDTAFVEVLAGCAAPRPGDTGTWLLPEMQRAYAALHRAGWAHSVEAWQQDRLVGGLYGVALGGVFFGESMFSRVSDASKVALVHLAVWLLEQGFRLIDCQVRTEHLVRLGAREIPRPAFIAAIGEEVLPPGPWTVPEGFAEHVLEWVEARRRKSP
ncbi:MAG: leucyl/phenylalanyl-tRNA--protein transferase [Gammaproteobacteria bacterium]|nr:MAG: leucyl/phenylalanyl-tRNA--protein transferase [Gammaproteobacteria bacterium]